MWRGDFITKSVPKSFVMHAWLRKKKAISGFCLPFWRHFPKRKEEVLFFPPGTSQRNLCRSRYKIVCREEERHLDAFLAIVSISIDKSESSSLRNRTRLSLNSPSCLLKRTHFIICLEVSRWQCGGGEEI